MSFLGILMSYCLHGKKFFGSINIFVAFRTFVNKSFFSSEQLVVNL